MPTTVDYSLHAGGTHVSRRMFRLSSNTTTSYTHRAFREGFGAGS